jgi:hypothetical protein
VQDAVEAAAKHAADAPALADAAAADAAPSSSSSSSSGGCEHDVLRVVIWFHHIKSTSKRKRIVEWARELGCSGFSKPGFPGIVIVEGSAGDVTEFVARVRALQWQAMQVRAEQRVLCTACCTRQQGSSGSKQQQQRMWIEAQGSSHSLAGGKPFSELQEVGGLSQMGAACKEAGLHELFVSALKL